MTKGDKIQVRRGPLSGLTVELRRHDAANRAWHCRLDYAGKDGATIAGPVMVWDYELAETVERKPKTKGR